MAPFASRLHSVRVRLTLIVAVILGVGLTAGGFWLVRAVDATIVGLVEEEHRAELHRVAPPPMAGGGSHVGAPVHRFTITKADGSRVEKQWIGPDEPPAFGSPADEPSPLPDGFRVTRSSPLDEIRRGSESLRRILVVGTPLLILVLTWASWILIARALRPVRVMTQQAARIASATTGERLVVPPTFDEVAELAQTLNTMLDRLTDGARRQQQFISDASHELRSPIAAARAQLEVALAHRDQLDSHAVMRDVLTETLRLESLVADLLALARLEENVSLMRDEIDLDDVVLEESARVRAVKVDTRQVTGIKVYGDRKSLSHLVRNLLDNAAAHATTSVAVSTGIENGAPVLRVDDDGPGIPEADRVRIFERFARLSSSRTRDPGGAGLGLAMVRRIAEQHHAVMRVDRSPRDGARFEVRFPVV